MVRDDRPLPEDLPASITGGTSPREAPRLLVTAEEAIQSLVDGWENPEPAIPTGLPGIDGPLYGGLRAGAAVIVSSGAGAGKSIVSSQVAYHAARAGASVIYASVEMDAAELGARWLAARLFADALQGDALGEVRLVTFGELLYAAHDRMLDLAIAETAAKIRAEVAGRLFFRRVSPGSSMADVARMVDEARQRTGEARALVVIDPLQRLYAAPQGMITDRVAEAANLNETERVGIVAQQAKELAETARVAFWMNSDTTKAAVAGNASAELALRGSYMLNHAATLVLGMATAEEHDHDRLLGAYTGGAVDDGRKDEVAESIRSQIPPWWFDDPKAALVRERLGGAVAVMECTKNRHGRRPRVVGALLRAVSLLVTHDPSHTPYPEPARPTPRKNRRSP